LQTSILKRDLTVDNKTTYNLTIENFDFGVRVDYTMKNFENGVWENLDQYLDFVVT